MTREEEIEKIASAFAIDEVKDTCNPASKRGLLYAGFVSGAEWADEHPVVKVGGALKNYERGYEEAIDKACEWLKDYAYMFVSETTGDLYEDDLINDFRKDMKGD